MALNASEDSSVTISGTTSGAEDDQTVSQYSSSSGGTPINTTASVSSNSYSVTGLDLSSLSDGTLTITADVDDWPVIQRRKPLIPPPKTPSPTISVAINDGGDGRLNSEDSSDGSVSISGTHPPAQ